MQQDRASFWADIKSYEERLAQDPGTYLFARLSEAYLKQNLLDDAVHTARQGVARYPAYVAGQRALALACSAKGIHDEARMALEAVTAAVPEDLEAQKMLGRLLLDAGDSDRARGVYRVILDFYPDEGECREELRRLEEPCVPSMEQPAPLAVATGEAFASPDEEIIDLEDEDIILLEELEELEEPEEIPVSEAAPAVDPLSTATLAELYVQQGFLTKALDIYRALASEHPENAELAARIAALETQDAQPAPVDSLPVEQGGAPEFLAVQDQVVVPAGVPVRGETDDAIATLEGWLDTIRRIKACR